MAWARSRPDILLMWQDECWFSRFAQPNAHDWGGITLIERPASRKITDKALACYGAIRDDTRQMHLCFCEDRPRSDQTIKFLAYLLDCTRQADKRLLILIWDHASWHKSRAVKDWIRAYNRQGKATDDVRLITWLLPTKSPWLNPIEPHWLHGKRAVLKSGGDDLTPQVLRDRLCAHFQVEPLFLHSNPLP